MDPQSYIQSGILESYVMGLCSAAERAEVERMAASHPEVRAELEAIEQALEKVALAQAVAPPADLKEKVLQQVFSGGKPVDGSKLVSRSLSWPWRLLAAMFVLGLAAAYFFNRQQRQAWENRLAQLEKQVTDCEVQARQQAKMQEQIAFLRDRSTQTIVLADGPEPKITATVWTNPVRRETLLDINSLPAPNPGKFFQFWAIVDGKPVSMGMVQLTGADSIQTLPYVENAQAFAISEEDNPQGNPTPTVVLLVGTI
ncbi:MAG: anti-sigma factor [Saprospiraceae bacterium]|nr:anti-sigma factor [Saprospiraceae bacterium]